MPDWLQRAIGIALPVVMWAPLLWCAAALRAPLPAERFGRRWRLGVGWLVLWVLPAIAAQLAWLRFGQSVYSMQGSDWIAIALWPSWVHLGGASAIELFEATAKSVSGHRQMTLMDNLPWFLLLVGVQTAVLASVFAWRFKSAQRLRDPLLIALGLAALANALCGVCWPWWGS